MERLTRRDLFKTAAAGIVGLVVGKESSVSAADNDLNDVRAQAQVAYRQGVDAEGLLISFAGYMTGQSYYIPSLEERRLIFNEAVDKVGKGGDALSMELWPDKLKNPNAPVATPSPKPTFTPIPTK